jgi:hypothetical protein
MQTSGESHAWRWRREPSRLTQVCIVTDGTVAGSFEDTLAARLGSAAQVALLHLIDPAATHAEWIASRGRSRAETRTPVNAIEQAIEPLPRDSRLLLCSQNVADLEWLGGVIGQRVFFAPYRPEANPEIQINAVIGTVEETLRASLTEKWGDSY